MDQDRTSLPKKKKKQTIGFNPGRECLHGNLVLVFYGNIGHIPNLAKHCCSKHTKRSRFRMPSSHTIYMAKQTLWPSVGWLPLGLEIAKNSLTLIKGSELSDLYKGIIFCIIKILTSFIGDQEIKKTIKGKSKGMPTHVSSL